MGEISLQNEHNVSIDNEGNTTIREAAIEIQHSGPAITTTSTSMIKEAFQEPFKSLSLTTKTIDIIQIPYFQFFVAFQTKAQPQDTTLVHGRIAHFEAALKGIQLGYRQCLRIMPAELDHHRSLNETFDLLSINVLGGEGISDIITYLKAGKTEYELDYKYYTPIKGNNSKARDAAFKLLYLMLLGELEN